MLENFITPGDETWTMKNGKTILVKDMEKGHLLNTLKMLEKSFNLLLIESNCRYLVGCSKEWEQMSKSDLESELGGLLSLRRQSENKQPILLKYLQKKPITSEDEKELMPEPTKESFQKFFAERLLIGQPYAVKGRLGR